MKITIFDPECPNYLRLEAMCYEAVAELGINTEVEKLQK